MPLREETDQNIIQSALGPLLVNMGLVLVLVGASSAQLTTLVFHRAKHNYWLLGFAAFVYAMYAKFNAMTMVSWQPTKAFACVTFEQHNLKSCQ